MTVSSEAETRMRLASTHGSAANFDPLSPVTIR
jgi:hypothetical protein